MTDYIIIGLLALAVIILVIVLIKVFSSNSKQDREARKEITDSVGTNVKNLGDMIATNQRTQQEALTGQLKNLEERFKTLEANNEAKLDSLRKTMDERLNAVREDNNKELEKIRGTVDEKLQKTLEDKMNESFKQVREQLENVYKGLGEMQAIASNVGDLKKVLSNVKTRGILGEIQLGAILSEILAPEQYAYDIAVNPDSRDRVEYAVKLPGEAGESVWLPIDSKFPADTYTALIDAYDSADPAAVEAAKAALIARIKQEAKDIKEKYICPPYTTNFAIMFLPFEGLYAEVVKLGLVETLQTGYNVNIAGPSTMAALLNSLQMGFKTLAIQKRSAEVWKILGAVKTEFGKFEEVLIKARQRLETTQADLDKLITTRSNAINRKLRDVERLDDASTTDLLGSSYTDSEE